jgi:outer membrane lipase/esterase
MHASRVTRRLAVFASSVALAEPSCLALAGRSDIDPVVTFGASLSDTGNAFDGLPEPANRHCGVAKNVPPYDALDDLLIPDGPYAKGGHHFSNGAT